MTDTPMVLEPCSDGVLAHLNTDPVPYPDLLGQLGDAEIGRLETVEIGEEYL